MVALNAEIFRILDRSEYVVRVIECNGGVIIKFPANHFDDDEDDGVTDVFDFRRGENPGLIHSSEFDDDRFIALPEYTFCTVLTVLLIRSCIDKNYPSDLIRFERESGILANSVAELIDRPTGDGDLEREKTFFDLIIKSIPQFNNDDEAISLDMVQGYDACKAVFLGDSDAS